jgi:hypothetical protein
VSKTGKKSIKVVFTFYISIDKIQFLVMLTSMTWARQRNENLLNVTSTSQALQPTVPNGLSGELSS